MRKSHFGHYGYRRVSTFTGDLRIGPRFDSAPVHDVGAVQGLGRLRRPLGHGLHGGPGDPGAGQHARSRRPIAFGAFYRRGPVVREDLGSPPLSIRVNGLNRESASRYTGRDISLDVDGVVRAGTFGFPARAVTHDFS